MAKAQPIISVRAAMSVKQVLPEIFSVRIAELWSWAEHMAYPERVRELHDMRIAAKRLRYCFEFFLPQFGDGFKPVLKEFKRLQDYLGEIHDCDVWVDYLRRQLRDALREINGKRKQLKRFDGASDPVLGHEADTLRTELVEGPAQGLLMLISEVTDRRAKLYDELLTFWRGQEAKGFHGKLVDAVAAAAREVLPSSPPGPLPDRGHGPQD